MSMEYRPEVHFSDESYAEFEQHLGGLTAKLAIIANDAAVITFGKDTLLNPTDISLWPSMNFDQEITIAVSAWHQTATPGQAGRLRQHEFDLSLAQQGEDAFFVLGETHKYVLTTREALLLGQIGNKAMIDALRAVHNLES